MTNEENFSGQMADQVALLVVTSMIYSSEAQSLTQFRLLPTSTLSFNLISRVQQGHTAMLLYAG